MDDAKFREEDDPPLYGIHSPIPDLLRDWHVAGARLGEVLKDAESRARLHPETMFGTINRFGDVRVHTQVRRTYANPQEKTRIVLATSRILEQTVNADEAAEQQRFEEALAALRREEERVFVTVLLGATRDLVYWNWRYGYTLVADPIAERQQRRRFNADLGRRGIAAPALAEARYPELVTDVATSDDH